MKSWLSRPVIAVPAMAVVYFFAARLGLAMAFTAEQVTLVWPPTGIALAAVLVFGTRVWPGIWLGAFVANALAHEPLAVAGGIATGNTLEALLAAWMLRRFAGVGASLERPSHVLGLVGLAAVGSTTVSATIGVTSLCVGAVQPWAAFGSLWSTWWLGDAMGDLLVAPVLLTWSAWVRRHRPRDLAEAGLMLAGVVALSYVVFASQFATGPYHRPLEYVVFPFTIWAALRFGPAETSLVSLAASSMAIWGTVHGSGPFAGAGRTTTESLILLQVFIGVIAISGLLLSAVTADRKHIVRDVAESEAQKAGILAGALDCIITMDADGRVVNFNPAAERTFGYRQSDAIGRLLADLIIPPDFRQAYRDGLVRYRETGHETVLGRRIEMRAVRADGSGVSRRADDHAHRGSCRPGVVRRVSPRHYRP